MKTVRLVFAIIALCVLGSIIIVAPMIGVMLYTYFTYAGWILYPQIYPLAMLLCVIACEVLAIWSFVTITYKHL